MLVKGVWDRKTMSVSSVFRNVWVPLGTVEKWRGCSSGIGPFETTRSEPKRIQVCGTDWVTWRDGSRIHAIQNACPHRGAPFHMGKTNGTQVTCPYHGWVLDGCGVLVDAPTDPEAKLCGKRIAKRMETVEAMGWIWGKPIQEDLEWDACERLDYEAIDAPIQTKENELWNLGIPAIPELDDPGWFATRGEFVMNAPWMRVFENAIDVSHIHTVHASSFGAPERAVVRTESIERSEQEIRCEFSIHHKAVNPLWSPVTVDTVRVSVRILYPNVSVIHIRLGRGVEFITYVCTVPIDETKSVNHYALIRNKAPGTAWDGFARRAMDTIFAEDRSIVEALAPVYGEVHVPSDKLQLAWRKMISFRSLDV